MRSTPSKTIALTALGALAGLGTLSFAACDGKSTTGSDDLPALQYGAAVQIGAGKARVYVQPSATAGAAPLEIGIALDDGALQGLPTADQAPPQAMGSFSYVLPLPAGMPAPYGVVQLNWNPGGHPPPGIYDAPHFDFHFYTVSPAERDAVLPSDPAFAAKAGHFPGAEFIPPGYMVLPPPPAPIDAVPMMGVHWLDVAAPELQPPTSPSHAAFTRTFIYGSWDGKFTFLEPMVTRAFLLTHGDVTVPIATPAKYAAAGYYPSSYRVSYDARLHETHVALTKLVHRP